MARIAVLMSTYNGEKYLEEQIESILAQMGDFQLELIVRDDGSTDATTEILERYAQNGKLTWYTGQNMGPAKSFMDLLHREKGYDYYAFADQDDFWEPNKLVRAVNKLEKIQSQALYCSNALLVNKSLESMNRNAYKNVPHIQLHTILCACNVLGCTMVLNKMLADMLTDKGLPKKMVMHDAYAAIVCAATGGDIVYEDYAAVKYRQHGSNAIGCGIGVIERIKQGIGVVLNKREITVADMASEILERYGNVMPVENRKWVTRVSQYNKSLCSRFSLACSPVSKYTSRNLFLRLSILFGTR